MDRPEDNRQSWAIYLALAVITFAVFSRVLGNGFVNFDDGTYVTENPMLQNGLTTSTVAWAFSTGYATNWHPLTWISHLLDFQLYGLEPAGHHLTNLLFHILNVLLLFHVLRRMTGAVWRSAVVAALFAWHPLHVESVAWVAERKDVLSTFFWLLAMLAYTRYASESKVQGPRSKVYYGLTLLYFALGLMSKPMLVTLPFVLLLLDYWPLNRIAGPNKTSLPRLLLEKTPFFLLAMASSVVTFIVQKTGGAVASLHAFPLGQRITNALVSYVRYLGKTVWPHDLAIFYPIHATWPAWQWIGAGLLIAAISLLAIAMLRRRPYFSVGWFWYLGTLVPVIGLVQVGGQSMADRYTYMPLVGIFIIFSWGAADLLGQGQLRRLSPAWALIMPVLAVCLTVTHEQTTCWKDGETLFRHAIAVTTNNSLAHVNLGDALDKAGRAEEAKAEFFIALNLEPDSPLTLTGLGTLFEHQGDVTNALNYFNLALSKKPQYGDAHYGLANLLAKEGRFAEAAEHYAQSLNSNPDAPDAQNNLGAMLIRLGQPREAVDHFKAALRLKPNYPEAQDQLGEAYVELRQPGQATVHFAEAARLKPDFAPPHFKLGLIAADEGQFDQAISQFLETIKLDPTNALAHSRLAGVFAKQGNLDEAAKYYREAVRLKPDDAGHNGHLAAILATQGKFEDAMKYYRESSRLKPDWPDPLRDLAWILATNPKAEIRNGAEALRFAQRACDLAGHPDPRFLSSLEVAYAEVGRFDDAIKTAQQIQQLATAPAQKRFAVGASNRLELYRAGKPYHE